MWSEVVMRTPFLPVSRVVRAGLIVLFALGQYVIPGTAGAEDAPLGSACAQTGNEAVATDKEDYKPSETVIVTGTGYAPECDVVVKITRPNGTVVVGDGSFAPGSDTVATSAAGDLYYEYILNGVEGEYLIEVLGAGDVVLASMTFTDGITLSIDMVPADAVRNATQTFSLL